MVCPRKRTYSAISLLLMRQKFMRHMCQLCLFREMPESPPLEFMRRVYASDEATPVPNAVITSSVLDPSQYLRVE
jgi:hypothetical protein